MGELVLLVFVAGVLWLGLKALASRSKIASGERAPISRADRNEEASRQKTLDANIGWLRERWKDADKARASGSLDCFPKWFFEPVTDKQLARLERMGVRVSGAALTKGAASDIIGLFEDMEDSDAAILKFFKVKLSADMRNETRARHETNKLFQDPSKLAAWRQRPADAMQKEFYRFFSIRVPQALAYEEASKTIRDAQSSKSDAELDAWRDFEDVCDELSDRSTLEDYGLKKPSLAAIRVAYDELRKSSKPKEAGDPLAVAEKILEMKPELARD